LKLRSKSESDKHPKAKLSTIAEIGGG
jgi:hypothetical protein